MKAILSIFTLLISFAGISTIYAEATELHTTPIPAPQPTVVQAPSSFQTIQWTSKDNTDVIKIENGTGTPIVVQITVSNRVGPKATGITIKNCGETIHLDLGSSTICSSSDPSNPISFSSDSATDPASGTYTIKQK